MIVRLPCFLALRSPLLIASRMEVSPIPVSALASSGDTESRSESGTFPSVEKIAKSQRLSVRYLHKLFENTDFSVSGYISRLRLSRCKEALVDRRNRGTHVMEIANLWGYTDASVFSRSFRREYGMSPTQFRLRQQTEAR